MQESIHVHLTLELLKHWLKWTVKKLKKVSPPTYTKWSESPKYQMELQPFSKGHSWELTTESHEFKAQLSPAHNQVLQTEYFFTVLLI